MKVSEAFLAEVNDLDPDNKYSRINPKLIARHRTHTYHSNKWDYLSTRQVYTDSEYHSVCTKTDRYFKHQIEALMNLLRGQRGKGGCRAKSMEKERIKLYSSDSSCPHLEFSSNPGDRRARSRPIERTHMTTSPFSTRLRKQLGHESLFDLGKNTGNMEASPSFSPLKERFKSEYGSVEGFKSISSDEFMRSNRLDYDPSDGTRRGRSGRDRDSGTPGTERIEIMMQPDQGYDSLRGSQNRKLRRSRRDRENKGHDMTFSNKDYESTPSHSIGDTEREYISTKESPKVPHLDELVRDRKTGREAYASSGTVDDVSNRSRLFNTPTKEATPPPKSGKGNEYIAQVLDIRFKASPTDNIKTGVFRSPIRPSRSINKRKIESDAAEDKNGTGSEKRKYSNAKDSEAKEENRKAFLTENSSYGSLANYSSYEQLPGTRRDVILKSDRSSSRLDTQSGRVTEREEVGPWARSEEEYGGMSSDNRTDTENKSSRKNLEERKSERKSERQTPRDEKKRSSVSNSEDLRDRLDDGEQLRKVSTDRSHRSKTSENRDDAIEKEKHGENARPEILIEDNQAANDSRDDENSNAISSDRRENIANKGLWNIEEDISKEHSRFSDPEHAEVSPYENSEALKLQEVAEGDPYQEHVKSEESLGLDSFREENKVNTDLADAIIKQNQPDDDTNGNVNHNETLDIDEIGKHEQELIQRMIESKNSVPGDTSETGEEYKEDKLTQEMPEEVSFAQMRNETDFINVIGKDSHRSEGGGKRINDVQAKEKEDSNRQNIERSSDTGSSTSNLSLNDPEQIHEREDNIENYQQIKHGGEYNDENQESVAQEEEQKSHESIKSESECHINIYENLNKNIENKYVDNNNTEQGEDYESKNEDAAEDKIDNLVHESKEEKTQAIEDKKDESDSSQRGYSDKEKISFENSELYEQKQDLEEREYIKSKESGLGSGSAVVEEDNDKEAEIDEEERLYGKIDRSFEKEQENPLEEVEKYDEETSKLTENVTEVQQGEEQNQGDDDLVLHHYETISNRENYKEEDGDDLSVDSLENREKITGRYEYKEEKVEQAEEPKRGWKKQAFSRQQTEKHEMTFSEENSYLSNDSLQNVSESKKKSRQSKSEKVNSDEEQVLEQNINKHEGFSSVDDEVIEDKIDKEEQEEEKVVERIEDVEVEKVSGHNVVEENGDRAILEEEKDNAEAKLEEIVITEENNGEELEDIVGPLEHEKQAFIDSHIGEEEKANAKNIEDNDQPEVNVENRSQRKESEIYEKANESQVSLEQNSRLEKIENSDIVSQQESMSNQESITGKSGSKRRGRNERKKVANKNIADEEAQKFAQEFRTNDDHSAKDNVDQNKTLSGNASQESFRKQENLVENLSQKSDKPEELKASHKGTLESQRSRKLTSESQKSRKSNKSDKTIERKESLKKHSDVKTDSKNALEEGEAKSNTEREKTLSQNEFNRSLTQQEKSQSSNSVKSLASIENNEQEGTHEQKLDSNRSKTSQSEVQKSSRKGTLASQRSDRKDSFAERKESLKQYNSVKSVKSGSKQSLGSDTVQFDIKEEEKNNQNAAIESLNQLQNSRTSLSAKSLSLVENNEQENILEQVPEILNNKAKSKNDVSEKQESSRKGTMASHRSDGKESLKKSNSVKSKNSDEDKHAVSDRSSHISNKSEKMIESLNNEQKSERSASEKNVALVEENQPEVEDQKSETINQDHLLNEQQKTAICVPVNSLVLDEIDQQEIPVDEKLESLRHVPAQENETDPESIIEYTNEPEPLVEEIKLDRGQNPEKKKRAFIRQESSEEVPRPVKSVPKKEKESVMGEDLTWEDIKMIRQIQLEAVNIIQRRWREFLQKKKAEKAQRAKFYLEKIDPEDLKAFANSLKTNESLSKGIRSFSPKQRKEDMIELMLAFVSSYTVLGKSQLLNRK